jgi:signal transduction histidine kinase/CheY-like chemotaxis protein/HPt (histidine-containing phosphotransfer) domain-containing protein
MNNTTKKNALFEASHMMILVTYTALVFALVGEDFLMGWEKWPLILIAAAIAFSWSIHIRQMFSDYGRLQIYVVFMMATMFFYGVHVTSAFDLALVMCSVIILCTTTGVKFFITLAQITYFVTFLYDLVSIRINTPEMFDELVISRSMLHIVMMIVVGRLARMIIDRWNQVLDRSAEEVEQLTETTGRLNDFLTNASHEIRTPTNAVLGLANMCLERETDPGQLEHLGAIRDAGKRLTELISDILDYADIDRGRVSVNTDDYMLSSVLHDLVMELKPHMSGGAELIIDVDPGIPSVMNTDISKLKKIIWHLATNALKFTRQGGVYVRFSAEARDYGINLLIDVSDTGSGMTEEEVDRLSDGFYHSNSNRARSSGGLGLGMAIVYNFVAALGGFMRIESRPGEGTDVRVCLPQTVVDSAGCMSVRDRGKLVIGGYLHFEKFSHPVVRDYYNTMVRNIVRGLGVRLHRAENIEDLKKLLENLTLTHLFVGAEEYGADAAFMERLAESVTVTVIAAEGFSLPEGSKAHLMEKPIYCFPVAAVLNRDPTGAVTERRMYCRGVRALIVDDEPLNITVAKDYLHRYGIETVSASSGSEAIAQCARESFDIVFMDHMMPGMDGIEALRRIRSDGIGFWKNVPFVALTANAGSTAREEFRKAGFDAFLAKPIDSADLERVLRSVLPKTAVSYDSAPPSPPGPAPRPAKAPAAGGSDAGEKDALAPLRSLGVDTEQGRKYCQSDDEFYRELLLQFGSEAAGKHEELERFCREGDMPNYAIRVHALKSTAKMIGASSLSEKARALETASLAGSTDEVRALHPSAMEEYEALTRAIAALSGGAAAETGGGEPLPREDGPEILEFEPEGPEVLEFEPQGEE